MDGSSAASAFQRREKARPEQLIRAMNFLILKALKRATGIWILLPICSKNHACSWSRVCAELPASKLTP